MKEEISIAEELECRPKVTSYPVTCKVCGKEIDALDALAMASWFRDLVEEHPGK